MIDATDAPARFRCVICLADAVVTIRSLTGYRSPVCRLCAELARALALPSIEAKQAWENPRTGNVL